MMIVLTYDVDLTTPSGAKRLRHVARLCERVGVRVQNSVFELLIDEAQYIALRSSLQKAIDPALDNVRFYRLGNHYEGKIDFIGKAQRIQQDGPLLL